VRLLVTGATGNVGTALLRRLAEDDVPDVEVVGLARRRPPATEPYDTARWVTADLADPSVGRLLRREMDGVDGVVHLAWMLQPARDATRMRATNLEGSRHVLQAARDAGVPHVVVASSAGAYAPGPKDRQVEEDWPTTGVTSSSYSRHKSALERMLDEVEREGGPAVARIRPMLVCQRRNASEVARLFLGPWAALAGTPVARALRAVPLPAVPVPPQLVFQVVHAADAADLFWRVLREGATGAFNVAAEPPIGPRELAAALGAVRPVPVPARAARAVVAATYRARLQPTPEGWLDLGTQAPLVSSRRAREELGWEPRWTGMQALSLMLRGMADGAGEPSAPMQPQGAGGGEGQRR